IRTCQQSFPEMIIQLIDNTFSYEMQKLTMAFFPDRKVLVDPDEVPEGENEFITVTLTKEPLTVSAEFRNDAENLRSTASEVGEEGDDPELAAGRVLYRTLSEVTGIRPQWGILTGVRPSKVMTKHIDAEGEEAAKEYFVHRLYTDPKKAELAAVVSNAERAIMDTTTEESISLYVGIPFCTSRCTYCSFVSESIASPRAKKLYPAYFEKLLQEIEVTGQIARETGRVLRTVYVGGGTPSTLSAEQTKQLLDTIHASFDFSHCSELTFEAGRADSITEEKLRACLEGGADRISINPQTMTDSILEAVGRRHTVQDVCNVFATARRVGFENINMDLIAGLPGDSPENFARSLEDVIALGPESVTVHTLAYKRSSSLIPTKELFARGQETSAMVNTANERLAAAGYAPYYMYRQTRSVGNLENVGWARPGAESAYNVFMMEECQTVFACGAGAVTKLLVPGTTDIIRVFNYKYPYEYVDRFDQLIANKSKVRAFYE
ncbi:MAG: coproporphyrinogen dehydrogenase HemZ, partial [Clostridia bacterium]|nr:coproporphyrinogen dehydrogenase HemZ [Clostridia bacterium]